MNERPCITIAMEHVRPCVIRQPSTIRDADYHLDYCVDAQCTGCVPRPALEGMMICEACYKKFTQAVSIAVDLITHLRSIERGAQSIDGIRSGALVSPSYPPSWQEADTLWGALEDLVRAARPDYWTEYRGPHYVGKIGFSFSATLPMVASAVRGALDELHDPNFLNRASAAMAAVAFYRAVQLANRRFNFPLETARPVPVKYIRCRTCRQMTLKWVTPLEQYDEVGIECANPMCRAWWDPVTALFDMRLLAQQMSDAGHATEAAEAEIAKMLRVPPRDEAWPICLYCSYFEPTTDLAWTRKSVDETCGVCGYGTDEGLYRRYAA